MFIKHKYNSYFLFFVTFITYAVIFSPIFALVKRFLTIFCFTVIVTAGTELHQLLKLPVLVQHFHEHQQEDKNVSLLRFIIIHYFSGSPKDKDYDRDMQLPFKTTDCSLLANIVVPLQPVSITTNPEFFVTNYYPAFKNNTSLPNHFSDIWQPPRIS